MCWFRPEQLSIRMLPLRRDKYAAPFVSGTFSLCYPLERLAVQLVFLCGSSELCFYSRTCKHRIESNRIDCLFQFEILTIRNGSKLAIANCVRLAFDLQLHSRSPGCCRALGVRLRPGPARLQCARFTRTSAIIIAARSIGREAPIRTSHERLENDSFEWTQRQHCRVAAITVDWQ